MPSGLVRRLALTAFFAVVATGLMAPLASNTFVPDFMDLPPHIAAAWQARLALDEGQFPLRVAPLEREGRRYAMFQLYGQLPYTAAAVLQKFALPDTPEAPYVALKAVVWASLLMGGLYMFLLARYLGARDAASLVAGVAYMAAPYLLVNLHARGAMPEGIAQGLLPVALYQLLRFVAGGGRLRFGKATLAATAVLLTHLITFAYSLAAAGLLILLLSRARIVRRLLRGAAVAAGTLVLCWYFVAPILALRGSLGIARGARGFMAHFVWLTRIPSLLSPSSVPPVPTGAMGLHPFIHPALGLVSVAGALLAAALWLRLVPAPPTRALRRFAPALLFVFALGLLLAWSPVDVWSHLPDIFSLAQFTYRQITLTMWSGALLLALALGAVLPRGHGTLAGAAGCTLVLMASGPYLTSAPPWKGNEAFQHIRQPTYRDTDAAAPYSVRLDGALLARPDTLVELAPPGSAPFEQTMGLLRRLQATPSRLHLGGALPPALAASGVDLTLRADGETLAAMHLEGAAAGRSVPITAPASLPDRPVTRLEWTALSPAGPVAAADLASLRAVIAPADRPFGRVHAPDEAAPGHASVNVFQRRGDAFTVRATADDEALLVLPLEYYPALLDVRLDDARVPYAPYATPSGEVLAAIRLPPGKHRVRGRFSGHRAANAISLAGWVALGALAASTFVRRRRGTPMTITRQAIPVEGGALPLTVARAGGTGAAVVIVPSAFGVGPDLEAQMVETAGDARAVVAIDPFFREDAGPAAYEDRDRAIGRLQALDRARTLRDLGAAIAWIRDEEGGAPVVVLGICFGGPFALAAAAEGLAQGVVTWHGTRMEQALARAAEMRCPMRLHFGAVDPFVPREAVETVRAAFAGRADVVLTVHEGATHGFSHRASVRSYDAAAERAGLASLRELVRLLRD